VIDAGGLWTLPRLWKTPGRAKHAREDRGVAFPTVAWKTLRVSHKRPQATGPLYQRVKRKEKKIFLAKKGLLVEAVENARRLQPLPRQSGPVSRGPATATAFPTASKAPQCLDEGGAFRKTRSSIPLAVDARRPDPASKETNAVLHLGRFW